MPRPKGSQNKQSVKALLAEIERLKNERNTTQNVPIRTDQTVKSDSSGVADPPPVNTSATDLKINVPVKPGSTAKTAVRKRADQLTKTYGCGNTKYCQYESDEKFAVCPDCGINQKWESDQT
jgi:hypothetical protein